jgi:nucleotide-binding universal stress UspA family protein
VKARPDSGRAGEPVRALRRRASVAPVMFRRILVPVDFSAGSGCVLRHAASLARAHRARVLPIHVTPPICFTVDCGYGPVNRAVPDDDALHETRVRLQRLVHRIVPAPLAEEVIVRCGEPMEQIVAAAKEWKADLIIMLAHVPLGGDLTPVTHTVDRLIREVRCPVLALHAAIGRGGNQAYGKVAKKVSR